VRGSHLEVDGVLSKPDSEYVAVPDAAKILGVSVSFLNKLRCYGGGPSFNKVGRRAVRYNVAALREWADSGLRRSTSDPGAA
jgi:Helix-turn-helix domain